MFNKDRNWLMGGVAASLVMIVGKLLGMEPMATGAMAAMAFVVATTAFVLEPLSRWIGSASNEPSRSAPQQDLAAELIARAIPLRHRLKAHGRTADGGPMDAAIAAMLADLDIVLAEIRRRPSDAYSVSRLISFYLPRTLDILDGRKAILGTPESLDKAADAESVVHELQIAFRHFATTVDRRGSELDLELRLVRASLMEDVGQRSAGA